MYYLYIQNKKINIIIYKLFVGYKPTTAKKSKAGHQKYKNEYNNRHILYIIPSILKVLHFRYDRYAETYLQLVLVHFCMPYLIIECLLLV